MLSSHVQYLSETNGILSALSRDDYPALFADLKLVALPRGKLLYELGDPMQHAFFILSGMVSLLAVTENGATTEISMVGNEGLAGISLLLGVNAAPLPDASANCRQSLAGNGAGPASRILQRWKATKFGVEIHALFAPSNSTISGLQSFSHN